MSRGELRVGTLALLARWTGAVRRHERIIRARWLTDPIGKILSFRRARARLDKRMRRGLCELGRRYQGILYEILATAGVPEEERAVCQIKIWQTVEARIRRDPEPWRVPRLLWSACVELGSPWLPERLRCKLMLRAFIEEMPESEERAELLRLAYQYQGEAFQDVATDEEALERLSLAYPLLHAQLLRNARRLADWSGGAFTPGGVSAMTFPYLELEDWLFDMSDTTGEDHAI